MLQLTVEAPFPTLRVIRVSGPLDQAGAPSLLRLVDAQLALVTAGRSSALDLLMDLSGVSSFEPRAMGVMRHIRYSAELRGVRVRLSGWSEHAHLLPIRVNQILREFSSFPTIDIAIAALASMDAGSAPPSDPPARHRDHPADETCGDARRGKLTVVTPHSTFDAGVIPFPAKVHDQISRKPATPAATPVAPHSPAATPTCLQGPSGNRISDVR